MIGGPGRICSADEEHTKNIRGDEIYVWMRDVKAVVFGFEVFVDFMGTTGLRYVEAIN